jgi:hypothetical protein
MRPDVTASDPAVVMLGAVPEPPILFRVNSLTVLFPKNVNADPTPFSVTAFVGAICPDELVIVTDAALIVSPPAGIDAWPAVTFATFRLNVPPFNTVPPV